jgi:predicted transcriptional regulator
MKNQIQNADTLRYSNAELATAFKRCVTKVLNQAAAESVKREAERNARIAKACRR